MQFTIIFLIITIIHYYTEILFSFPKALTQWYQWLLSSAHSIITTSTCGMYYDVHKLTLKCVALILIFHCAHLLNCIMTALKK